MEVTTKQLRIEPGRIISEVHRGQEFTVTYRGNPVARIVPISSVPDAASSKPDELFGIWKDRESMDVEQYVRDLRKGRRL